jgi:two-component system, NtrC family, nitrogen regulation sensor histidine kinase NtrY
VKLRFQDRVLFLTFISLGPAWLVAAIFIFNWDVTPVMRWSLFILVSAFAVIGAFVVRRRVIVPLQSLANLLEALREGDYSLRGRNVDPRDAVGEVMVEVNSLSRTLHHQRLQALEAGVLLEKVISEVDLAVFAFDWDRRLRLANRAGERLLDAEAPSLLGRDAASLGLADLLDEPSGRIVNRVFPGGSGRWEVRKRGFREDGRPHELLVISELSRALREEERQAWQRLVRVIGHELNNSLAPIKSMAGTLRSLISREPLADDWREDAAAGLTVIGDRAESLGRFMGAYAQLARLPAPKRRPVELADLVEKVVSLVRGARIRVEGGPALTLQVDGDQLEQVLINLVKNALEADAGGGTVRIRWRADADSVVVEVEDDGPGIARTDNLWVPFFTTKPGGTGIGLVLCREIVENHGGRISLENRAEARGAVARLHLPRGGKT